jgi:predicted dehydrogenase
VDQARGFLAVTYNYTGYAMLRELRRITLEGGLGKLNQIHIEMPQEGFARLGKDGAKPRPQSWRQKDGDIPTLSLDLGVHLHHIIDFLSGEKPVELVALNNSYGLIEGIVDNTLCIARYSNDLHCQLWFGKTALGHRNGLRVRVYGSSGSAEWYQMEPEVLTHYDNQGRISRYERACADVSIADEARYNRFKAGHPGGFLEAFANHYCDIADCLVQYRETGAYASPWVFSADIAEQGLIMLEAMAQSARDKTWLPVARPAGGTGPQA